MYINIVRENIQAGNTVHFLFIFSVSNNLTASAASNRLRDLHLHLIPTLLLTTMHERSGYELTLHEIVSLKSD